MACEAPEMGPASTRPEIATANTVQSMLSSLKGAGADDSARAPIGVHFQNLFNSSHPQCAKSSRARRKKAARRNFSVKCSDRLDRLDRIVTFLNNINVFRVESSFLSNLSVVLRGKIIPAVPNAHDFAIPRHFAKQDVGGVSI